MPRTIAHRGFKIQIDAGGAAKRAPKVAIDGEAVAVLRSADGKRFLAPDLPYNESSSLTSLAKAVADHRAEFEAREPRTRSRRATARQPGQGRS